MINLNIEPMERAAKVLSKMKLTKAGISGDQLAVAAWSQAVGKTIARRTRAVGLFDGTLVIDVEDALWERNLSTLQPQILGKLTNTLGPGKVRHLRFRVGAPKREPQREEQTRAYDEADSIADPILRRIYIQSRKRSTA